MTRGEHLETGNPEASAEYPATVPVVLLLILTSLFVITQLYAAIPLIEIVGTP